MEIMYIKDNMDKEILEIMLELAEDENKELKEENDRLRILINAFKGYNSFLEKKNKDLVKEYDNLTDINRRLN